MPRLEELDFVFDFDGCLLTVLLAELLCDLLGFSLCLSVALLVAGDMIDSCRISCRLEWVSAPNVLFLPLNISSLESSSEVSRIASIEVDEWLGAIVVL
jgi:hypothetical protein